MVVQRGYRQAADRTTSTGCARRRPATSSTSITNGFGVMPDYRAQIPPEDRWRIVAYIRALQLTQRRRDGGRAGGELREARRTGDAGAGAGAQRR